MPLQNGSSLLARSVFFRDVRLGEIEDLLLAGDGRRVLGFVVLCGDGARRMLPLSAADAADDRVQVPSAFVLMDDGFYRERGRTLTALRGAAVVRDGEEAGRLTDVRVAPDGRVGAFVVEAADGEAELASDPGVLVDAAPSSLAP